jgi:hypothetical protein
MIFWKLKALVQNSVKETLSILHSSQQVVGSVPKPTLDRVGRRSNHYLQVGNGIFKLETDESQRTFI